MKIRNGFVSNSSSSSFIVFGKQILNVDVPNLIEADLKKKIMVVGKDLSEGTDFFEIHNKQMLEYAQNNEYLKRCTWLNVLESICTEGEPFVVPESAAGAMGIALEVDYNVSEDIDQLKMRYDDLY